MRQEVGTVFGFFLCAGIEELIGMVTDLCLFILLLIEKHCFGGIRE